MRPSIFTFLLLAISFFASGQGKDYLSASFITAFPVGDFARADLRGVSPIYGYAKTGFGGDVTYVHKDSKSVFGFAATVRVRYNKVDTATMLTNDRDAWNPNVSFNWTKNEVKWLLTSVMIGGYVGKPLTSKLILNARILTGIANATLPGIDWTATAQSPYVGSAAFSREKANTICISTCIASGIEVSIGKKMSLLVNGEYWHAKPTFKNVSQSYFERFANGSSGASGENVYIVDMSTVNINVGFAFSL